MLFLASISCLFNNSLNTVQLRINTCFLCYWLKYCTSYTVHLLKILGYFPFHTELLTCLIIYALPLLTSPDFNCLGVHTSLSDNKKMRGWVLKPLFNFLLMLHNISSHQQAQQDFPTRSIHIHICCYCCVRIIKFLKSSKTVLNGRSSSVCSLYIFKCPFSSWHALVHFN